MLESLSLDRGRLLWKPNRLTWEGCLDDWYLSSCKVQPVRGQSLVRSLSRGELLMVQVQCSGSASGDQRFVGWRWGQDWEVFKPPGISQVRLWLAIAGGDISQFKFKYGSILESFPLFCPQLRYASLAFCNSGIVISIPLGNGCPWQYSLSVQAVAPICLVSVIL